jgi:hypothetical protein
MREGAKIIFICFASATILSCAGLKKGIKYEPAESLTEIISELQRQINYDSYKFASPRDSVGRNIFKATLEKLDNYEKVYPGRFNEIIAFNKAKSWEKLQDYETAIRYFKEAEQYPELREVAQKNIKTCEEFYNLKKPYEKLPGEDMETVLTRLDKMIDSWEPLIRKYSGTPYQSLAREEQERIEFVKVLFIEQNWFHQPKGKLFIHNSYRSLIKKHLESKNIYRYFIKFGDFYTRLAHEYAEVRDPEGFYFERKEFEKLSNVAEELYEVPAAKDGAPEKLEAKGKLNALLAYINYVYALNQ